MKINGVEPKNPYTRTVVIPRGVFGTESYQEFVFVFRGVRSKELEDVFDKLPEIKPPFKQTVGDDTVTYLKDDPKYLKKLEERDAQRVALHFLLSISATEGIEWATIDMDKPETYTKYEEELENAGFNKGEIMKLLEESFEANGMNSNYIDQATNRFLAGHPETPDA